MCSLCFNFRYINLSRTMKLRIFSFFLFLFKKKKKNLYCRLLLLQLSSSPRLLRPKDCVYGLCFNFRYINLFEDSEARISFSPFFFLLFSLATKVCLLRQNFCHEKHVFVATKLFATIFFFFFFFFSRQKLYLWQIPPMIALSLTHNLKQKEAQSACAESANKGVN